MVKINVDGGCLNNGTPNAKMYWSVATTTEAGTEVHRFDGGHGTNNIAEYQAIIYGAKIASYYMCRNIDCVIQSDSQLAVNQIHGVWKCKDAILKGLKAEALEILKELNVTLEWVSRDVSVAVLGH